MKKFALILLSAIILLSLTACDNTVVQEETTEEQTQTAEITTTEEIRGLLYAVIDGADTRTNEFMCVGGTVTPERIAAGFTGWTGINFGVTSVTDEQAKTITITWKDTSAAVTKDLTANEGFVFTDYETMKTFMENSLKETIVKNMGDYTIEFTPVA